MFLNQISINEIKKMTICKNCVMDNSNDLNIHFNSDGVCNYCVDFLKKRRNFVFNKEQSSKNLDRIKSKVLKLKDGDYDLITGISGGVDSSYLLHLIKEVNLNPLVVHFDNGWNSDLAVTNIKNLLDKTGFDFITEVIDWEEFKSLQRSFLKSSVVDIEILTDHAITATLYKYSKKYNVRTIFSGSNYLTEHGMPSGWSWQKSDLNNIIDINKKFENIEMNTFPTFSTIKIHIEMLKAKFKIGKWIQKLQPLDQINYSKTKAIEVLSKEYNWVYYGEKHYESTFTEFYQAYILFKKFKIDKRRPHISCLIRKGEISRNDALQELIHNPYKTTEIENLKKDYFIKKIGFSAQEFEKIMKSEPLRHDAYKNDQYIFKILQFYRRFLNPKNLIKKIWKRF